MRLLFVKETLAWPRSSGHDVHCFYMMQALTQLGHQVALISAKEPLPEALAGLPLAAQQTFAADGAVPAAPLPLTRLQERFRSYWGISPARVADVARFAGEWKADAVVAVGLNVLPYLGAVESACRIWYAADEWAWHHFSQVRLMQPSTWGNIREAVVKGLYERAYGSILDRVWVVTEADRRAMRWVAGVSNIDVIPNGVDGEHYRPLEEPQQEQSCVFWGRLDFGPNIQALEWFCRHVWPGIRQQVPDARFTIYGFNPTEPVRALAGYGGVKIIADLADLRWDIARHQVVVLPFVSGGGIKNKLLEAAGMGKAIVCTTRACQGLRLEEVPPFVLPRNAAEWCREILALWAAPQRRDCLGAEARQWVLKNHSWKSTARDAIAGLERSLREQGR